MRTNIMVRKNIISVILVLLTIGLYAQENFILHNFHAIPQNYLTNPALKSPSRLVVGFPALSSIHVGFNSNSFTVNELIKDEPGTSSQYVDVEGVISSLKNDMDFDVNLQNELFFVGFRIKKGFISMGIGLQNEGRFSIDKNLLELFWYGNAHEKFYNKMVDLSGTDFNMFSYLQYHLGFSYNLDEDWTVGARVKFLKGFASIDVEKFEGSVYTHADADNVYTIESTADVLINTSLLDDFRFFDDDFDDAEDIEFSDIMRQQNNGVAFDFGARYSGFEKIELALSIIDLGSITWKENVINYYTDQVDYDFTGVEYNDDNDNDVFDELSDEIDDHYKFEKKSESFKTALSTKFYLSGSYTLDEKSQVDALVYGRAFDGNLKAALSLGINRQFGRTFGLRMTYSMYNQEYFNVGLGMSLNLGPIQTYFLTDNIIAAVAPYDSQLFNFRFGFNVNIRDRRKAKVVIEEETDDYYEEVQY